MPARRLSKPQLWSPFVQATNKTRLLKVLSLTKKHGGSWSKAAAELGCSDQHFGQLLRKAKVAYPDVSLPKYTPPGPVHEIADLQAAVNAYAVHGDYSAAGRALGLSPSSIKRRMAAADKAGIHSKIKGTVEALKPKSRPLPPKGKIFRYITSAVQANTLPHVAFDTFENLAKHLGAELMLSTFSYKHRTEGSAKRGHNPAKGIADVEWYDERFEPYFVDEMVQLAPALIWNGHMNIIPTATDPLSDLQNYNYRASSIFPHAKLAMVSIAADLGEGAKLQYTTGAVTQRNYIQKKAGQKAEFDHVFGALLIEVDHRGKWWVRQLNADNDGTVYDAGTGLKATPLGVSPYVGNEAVIWGDIHNEHLPEATRKLCWGVGGVLDQLKPKEQVFHDLIDFENGHHNRKDPYKMFELHAAGRTSIIGAVKGVGTFLRYAARPFCRSTVIPSNHHEHIDRWMREIKWAEDLENAEFQAEVHVAALRSLRKGTAFHALEWAIETYSPVKPVQWLTRGQQFIICGKRGGGIALHYHGDRGSGGARGSIKNFARLGRKTIIGHGHGAGIFKGCWQVGVMVLDLDYARGSPSNWTITFCVVTPNGKRQLCTIYAGDWRA